MPADPAPGPPRLVSGSSSRAPPGIDGSRAKPAADGPSTMRRCSLASPGPAPSPGEGPPRRSSNLSDYSSEARDILNPRPPLDPHATSPQPSLMAPLSLAFALLPAISGLLFENGSAIVTDVMLLGLAGVFLHWSVTQPWVWYHAAQEVRILHEPDADLAIGDDGRGLTRSSSSPFYDAPAFPLEEVPEEVEAKKEDADSSPPRSGAPPISRTTEKQAAHRELYIHEVLALVACLALPAVGACLLHAIRKQLSRPSEGLVSNYNLTIFLLVSELRVFSHMLKLVQARTLRLQRVVHEDPLAPFSPTDARFEETLTRLERLEALADAAGPPARPTNATGSSGLRREAAVARDVRNSIQPDLDALNRAVRRYEKKATLLQLQTDARFAGLESRLDDAIALAAAAAKNSPGRRASSSTRNVLEYLVAIVLMPLNLALHLVRLPIGLFLFLLRRNRRRSMASGRGGRPSGIAKGSLQARYGNDGLSSRVARR